MKKKIMIIIVIISLFLVGSLVGMVSSIGIEQDENESCFNECNDCDSKYNDSNNCKAQENKVCDGLGTCSQNRQQQENCKSNSGYSGSCSK